MDLSNLEIVDVADIVEEVEEDSEEIRQDDGKKGRGADIHLEEFAYFKDHIEYKESEVYAEIKEFMSRKSNRPTLVARKEQWVCRFSHKRGFQICKRQYMVAFPHQSMDVVVYHTPDAQHIHEEDPNYFTKENYSWTTAQESIVMQGIRNNVKNTLILRQLKEAGAANGSGLYPNLRQVGVKKRYMKSVKLQTNTIVNVAHLRQYCESNSVPPEDENQFYIPYFYISGEETPNLEITVIWTTLNLISRMSVKMLQDDATYKLNWYQYPVFCCGRSSPTGRFFATHIALSSREDTSAWVRVYAWVKTIFPSIPR